MSNLVHAVARVRALETNLLTSSHVDRMISASYFEDAYAVLDDLGYGLDASRSRDTLDFEEVLESGLFSIRNIFALFGDVKIFSLATLLIDIQNIKLAVKAKKDGCTIEDVSDMLVSYGSYLISDIDAAVFQGEGSPELSLIVSGANVIDSQKESEKHIEDSFFKLAEKKAGEDEFLNKYISLLKGSEELKEKIIENGFSEDLSSSVSTIWKDSIEKSKGDVSTLETAVDEKIVQVLTQEARGEIDGYSPLISFFWRKERNARVIRSILLAKKAEIDPDTIRNEFTTFEF